MNESTLIVITIVNIFILVFSTFNLFGRKHISNLLLILSIWSLAVIEVAKFALLLDLPFGGRILSLGFNLTMLFWLITSISFLPKKTYSAVRIILSPLLGMLSIVFILIWWITPFMATVDVSLSPDISKLVQYFFVLFILNLSLSLSNMERSYYFLKEKRIKLLFISALFLLLPYIFLATQIVVLSKINYNILIYSSLSTFVGAVIFLFSSQKNFFGSGVKEYAGIHTSLILFLLGGYLFFIGAFIKLFHLFGWNLNTLFSFLTTFFVFFILFFLVFSSSIKERMKKFLLKSFTRQKYDWQKIWEEFTFKISLVTEIDKIKQAIQDAILEIMDVSEAKVFTFDNDVPFEEEFCDWLLRESYAFKVYEVFSPDFSLKYPEAKKFFLTNNFEAVSPLFGNRKIIGIIGLKLKGKKFLDNELLKVLSLQASSVILNCWANQAVRELEKKESIYKMSSFVIHDVKNYVNNLSLLISNKDKINNPEFQKDAFFTLENTTNKMKKLIDEFKSLRGEIALNKKEHNLKGLVEESVIDLGKERINGIKLDINVEESLEIQVDSHHFGKVILNLLINAIEAMEGKGNISVEANSKNGSVSLLIKDTGKGMTEDFIENRLFKPFSSTKKQGMGIGLYQCKSIIEAHNGTIVANSSVNVGTTFTITLPK